jgi:hypothetical protein
MRWQFWICLVRLNVRQKRTVHEETVKHKLRVMSTPTVENATQSNNQQSNAKQAEISFGNGRYSLAMKELYQDSQRIFKLTSDKAEKVARQFGSDFGAYMRDAEVSVKLGKKVNDNGQLTLGESCKVKGCAETFSIAIARAVAYANEALKHNISVVNTQWHLAEKFVKWIDGLK